MQPRSRGRRRPSTRPCRRRDGVDVPDGHRLPVEGTGALGDDTETVVAGVGDDDVARAVHTHAEGNVERGRGCGPPVARVREGVVARDRVCVAGGHRHAVEGAGGVGCHTDGAVVRLGDDVVAEAVDGHCGREPHLGLDGRRPVPRAPRKPVAGDGVDVPGGHRDPVEGAGGHGDDTARGGCQCRRSRGCGRRRPQRLWGRSARLRLTPHRRPSSRRSHRRRVGR